MRKRIFIVLLAVGVLAQLGCGGPAIGDLKSIQLFVTPATNLSGEGATVQLAATGTYTTGFQQDITKRVTFTTTPTGTTDTGAPLLAPPNTITVSPTGLITAVTPFVCTWVDTSGGTATPTWALTGSYQMTATYNGITSQPVFIGVGSATSTTSKTGQCGP